MRLRIILTILMLLWTSGPSDAFETVSLKKYPHLSIPISNPVDLTKLPVGKTFQVNHPHFVLQFFFNEQEILGMIFKRDKKFPLYMRSISVDIKVRNPGLLTLLFFNLKIFRDLKNWL